MGACSLTLYRTLSCCSKMFVNYFRITENPIPVDSHPHRHQHGAKTDDSKVSPAPKKRVGSFETYHTSNCVYSCALVLCSATQFCLYLQPNMLLTNLTFYLRHNVRKRAHLAHLFGPLYISLKHSSAPNGLTPNFTSRNPDLPIDLTQLFQFVQCNV